MSYLIRLYNNTLLTTVPDGQVDNTTSLNLIGKNVSGFGQYQNDNFVWLLENFASDSEPVNKLQGQIWFDNKAGMLRPMAYDGNNWRPLGVTLYSTTSTDATINPSGDPVSASQPGDFWYKSDDRQLYIATTSSGYQLIGPERVPGFLETKMRSTAVADSTGTSHPVVELIINGENMAIFSQKTFASTSSLVATGFPTIYRGITFKNYSAQHRSVTTSTDVALYGIPNLLDATYPQRNVSETIASRWTFQNGLSLGGASGTASIISDDNIDNLNVGAGGANITFSINNGTGVAKVLQEGIIPSGNNLQQLGNISNLWKNVYSLGLSAGTPNTNATLDGQWQLTNNSRVVPFADLGNDLGTSVLRYNSIYAGTLSSGPQQGTLAGNWKLDTNTGIIPNSDYGNSLGSPAVRFDTVYARTFNAGINNPGNLVGSWAVKGDMLPADDVAYNLGAPGSTWRSATIGDITANTITAGALTAQITSLTDSASNAIAQFDNDVRLTANLASRVPTQYAVKNYVDAAIALLQQEINALSASLNAALNNFTAIPAGTIMHHGGSSAPSGFLICDGSTVLTTSYPDLFAAIGYTYGGGGTEFALPNLLGEFIRGWDRGRGIDSGRNLGSVQSDNVRFLEHYHVMPGDDQLTFAGNSANWPNRSLGGFPYDARSVYGGGAQMWLTGNAVDINGNNVTNGGETRPRNVALLPIIKFRNGS
jgi:microcystin-dependent protein